MLLLGGYFVASNSTRVFDSLDRENTFHPGEAKLIEIVSERVPILLLTADSKFTSYPSEEIPSRSPTNLSLHRKFSRGFNFAGISKYSEAPACLMTRSGVGGHQNYLFSGPTSAKLNLAP